MSTDLLKLFAKNLKHYREQRGLSQAKLAEASGVSLNYVSLIEIGRKFPGPDVMATFISVLNVKPFLLFLDFEVDKEDSDLRKLVADGFVDELSKNVMTFVKSYGNPLDGGIKK